MLKSYFCIDCGETDPTRFQGSHRRCRRCVDKRRRNKPGYREKQAAFYKDWYEKKGRNRRKDYKNIIYLWNQEHEDIVKIHQMISAAIKKGVLVRPEICSICGNGGELTRIIPIIISLSKCFGFVLLVIRKFIKGH